MKKLVLSIAAVLALTPSVLADPRPGRAFPTFTVDDLAGNHRSRRDLQGRWTVAFAMTDKDLGPAVSAWRRLVEHRVPPQTQVVYLVALDLFGLVSTSTILSQARGATPRPAWERTWFSRDGSLADQLGLPESETPWVFVIDPTGRVALSLHADATTAGAERVLAALNPPPPPPETPPTQTP